MHRLSGIVSPANAVYSAAELEHQLKSSNSKALITCIPLLETAVQAAKDAGIPENRIFILEIPGLQCQSDIPYQTIEGLIAKGGNLPQLEPLEWKKGQGARQPAFLSYSSGTSGLPVS